MSKLDAIITLMTVVWVALSLSCANQAMPGGGPKDETPPKVIASSPEDGQVNVSPRGKIVIRFSEWINTASAYKAVSLRPIAPTGIAVKASKDRITIIPKKPLDGDATYKLAISESLQDLRGNAIKERVEIFFSTGNVVDKEAFKADTTKRGDIIVDLAPIDPPVETGVLKSDTSQSDALEDDGINNR